MSDKSSELEAGARRKRRVGFGLSSLVTAIFFALVIIMAFEPKSLALPLYGDVVTLGLVATLAFLLLTFLVMGGYVWWRERRGPTEP
ncbi:MAG: DUF485 domain-containing protein [Vicinamibacteria bacterium]